MPAHEVGVLPPERRELLIRTAAREFAAAGFQHASLNRIIRSCRMSKSSFYHYFGSKEALFDAVVTDVGASLLRAAEVPAPAKLASGRFWDELAELGGRLQRATMDESMVDLGRLFYLPDAPRSAAMNRARAAIDGWLDEALAAGRSSGAVRDDLPPQLQARLTLAVLWAMDEWSLEHAAALPPAELERLVGAQLDALRRLLAG